MGSPTKTRTRSLLSRYGVALLVPWVALSIRVALTPLVGDQLPLMIFILAGAIAAWLGGLGPGLVAYGLGGAISVFVYFAPLHSLSINSVAERTRLACYFVVGVVVSAMAEALHRSLRQAQAREKALRESEDRYRGYVSTSHEAIWRIELDEPIPVDLLVEEQVKLYFERAYYAEANDALAHLYGFAHAAEVAGLRVREVEPPERAETRESMRSFILGGYRRTGEVSHEQTRTGEPRNFLNNYVGMVEKGYLVRLWGSSLDITAHKRAERALRETEATLKAFYDSSPVLMGMLEITGTDILHLYDNPATCRFMGVEPGQSAGRWASKSGTAQEVLEFWIARSRECMETGAPVSFELRHDYEGMPHRWLSNTIVYIGKGSTGHPRFCYVSLDITARHQFEEDLAQARDRAEAASRAKDDFLATLSHELRNPLNPVLLTAGAALLDPALSHDDREQWEMVHRNVTLQARLIDDLLDLTRVARGKFSLQVKPLDAHSLVRDALANVRADFLAKRQLCELGLDASVARIQGDNARLQQVLWNLLKNASKFTPEGGSIRITSCNPGANGTVRLAVTDSGIGLTAEELNRIFEAFVQGDHAQRGGAHRFGGLGLGLAISQQIVQLHSGRIWAESEGRERGATFYIELPVA